MGFFSKLNKVWSGTDFWQGDENRKQREDFARKEEEDRERKRQQGIQQAFNNPQPGSVVAPTQPQVKFDPTQPLQKFNPISNTGFNNPLLNIAQQSPAELEKMNAVTKDNANKDRILEELYQANLPRQRRQQTSGEGWFGRNILNRKAIEERTQLGAREAAARQYQEKYGYNNDPKVLEYRGDTKERQTKESDRLRKDGENLQIFADTMTGVAEDLSYVPVTGSVINLGLAGTEKIADATGNTAYADDIESQRLQIDAGMTKEEFDQLAPQASKDEFDEIKTGVDAMSDNEFADFKLAIARQLKQETGQDIDVSFGKDEFLGSFNMDIQQKIRNMQTLGLALSPLDFIGAAGLAKSGVTSAGKAAFKEALKTGSKKYALGQAVKTGFGVAAKESVAPFIAGSALSVGAQGYLGGFDNINPLEAAKTGGMVAGTSLLFPTGKGAKSGIDDVARVSDDVVRGVDGIDEAVRSAGSTLSSEVSSGIKKTVSVASGEADDLPGTRRVESGELTPSVDLGDGIKSTNQAANIPDPNSPIALARPDEFSSQAPIANFDSAPVEPGQLQRATGSADDLSINSDKLNSRIQELTAQANDLDTPAFQRQAAKKALSQLMGQADEIQARNLGVADGPLDRPSFQHQDDLKGVISEGQAELDNFMRENPDASMMEIENAKASIESQVVARVEELQKGRFGGDVDAQGNAVLKSDAQVAREMADQGVPLQRGGSQSAATENLMATEARQAVDDQVLRTPESELLQAVDQAQGAYDDVAKIRQGERGERIAAGGNAYDSAGGGEAGYRAKLSQLKGKYSESGFEPVGLDSTTQNQLLDAVETSGLRDFEKVTAQRGLRKIWGASEGKPVPSELNLIRRVFGETGNKIADQVEQALAESPKNWKEKLVDIAGIPRTAMTSFDFSMGLRQGSGVMFTNFPQWMKANKESVKYAFNGKYFDEAMNAIKNDDAYTLITDKMNVRLPGAIGEGAELMSSKDILENIPVYGKGIEGSNRAYTGGLTKLRYEVAKKWVDSLGGVDEVAKLTDTQLADLGEVVNTFTGSGGKMNGLTDKHIQTLSSTLFAPRLWASRLNMLNPRFYQRLSPVARKAALKNMASFMGAATATTGLLEYAIPGVEVEKDPRSSDFLKIKVGNTRYDIFSGLQQNIVLGARLATGEKKSSTSGEMVTLGDGYGDPSRFDVGVDALQNKFNPVLGLVSRYMQSGPSDEDSDNPLIRTDKFGEEVNFGTEVAKMGAPLGLMGVKETYDDTGDFKKAALMNLPGIGGVGVQTYGEIPTKEQDRYNANEDLKTRKKALDEAGIPITADKIGDLAKVGDYEKALQGAEYRLAELEQDEDATENSKNTARRDIEDYKFGQEHGYVPSSNEAVETRAERGEYGAAIAGWNLRLQRDEAEGNTPESKLKSTRDKIKRYEIFDKYNIEPDMAVAYEKTTSDTGGVGVTAWRDMMDSDDPKVVAYAEKLYNLDQALIEEGVVKEPKYYWGKNGRGGGKGSSPRFSTDIGKIGAPSYNFNPQKLEKASAGPVQSEIASVDMVPNYSREKKQISVNRGRTI